MNDRATMDSAGAMIAFHLSVPYGPDIVKEQDVYKALKNGSLDGIASPAKDVLVSLFNENSPTSILKAVYECGSSVENAEKLYREITELPFHRSPDWEKVAHSFTEKNMPVESVDIQSPGILEKILSRATEILVEKYGASLIVFHGSRHFGDPYPDSDIDLLVVKDTDDQYPQKREREAEALLAGIGAPVPFDIQVWTPEEVRWGLSEGQTYIGVALANGRVLYGKEELFMTEEYFYNIQSWLDEARRHFDQGKMSLEKNYAIGAMDELFQSTERYMKAFLMTKGIKVDMVHSLPGLLDQAVKYEPSWESLRITLEVSYEWGRACHYPPRKVGEVRIIPTLAEVKELFGKLDPWLKTLDRTLEKSIEHQEKHREKKDHGFGF